MLPPGVHEATFSDIERCFVTNERRKTLYEGLLRGCQSLKSAGCALVYLDGSYVTEKPTPGDFDLCWDPTGVDPTELDPVLLDFDNRRRNQKQKYGGEFFPSSARADGSRTFVDFFRTDRDTGKEKGIILIRL